MPEQMYTTLATSIPAVLVDQAGWPMSSSDSARTIVAAAFINPESTKFSTDRNSSQSDLSGTESRELEDLYTAEA